MDISYVDLRSDEDKLLDKEWAMNSENADEDKLRAMNSDMLDEESEDFSLLRHQLEFYFSDRNYFHDTFLLKSLQDDGWFSLSDAISFPKIKKISQNNPDLVLKAAQTSKSILVVSEDKQFIRRNPSLPTPSEKQLQAYKDGVLPALSIEAIHFFRVGSEFYKSHNWQDAVEAFTIAIELNINDDGRLFLNRALAYMQLKDYEHAMKDLMKIWAWKIYDDSSYAKACFTIGLIHYRQKKFKDSVSFLHRALTREPNNETYLFYHRRASIEQQDRSDKERRRKEREAFEKLRAENISKREKNNS